MGNIRWYWNGTFSNSRKNYSSLLRKSRIKYSCSGKGIYITSKDINKNFQLFIIYIPFSEDSKILESILFNQCIRFTLPSIDNSQSDTTIILYNSIKISKKRG